MHSPFPDSTSDLWFFLNLSDFHLRSKKCLNGSRPGKINLSTRQFREELFRSSAMEMVEVSGEVTLGLSLVAIDIDVGVVKLNNRDQGKSKKQCRCGCWSF